MLNLVRRLFKIKGKGHKHHWHYLKLGEVNTERCAETPVRWYRCCGCDARHWEEEQVC